MTRSVLFSVILASTALCQTNPSADEQSRAIIDKSLKESNPDTRKQAVIALSLAGTGEPFLSQLESMLDDKDVQVRLAAVASLVTLAAGMGWSVPIWVRRPVGKSIKATETVTPG